MRFIPKSQSTRAEPELGGEAPAKRRGRKRVMAGLALAAVASATAITGAATAASASPLNGYAVLLSPSSSFDFQDLDVSGASQQDGAPVIQWWENDNANQQWYFEQTPDGNYWIVNENSGLCLTSDLVAGDGVYQWPCNDPQGKPGDVNAPNGQEWSTSMGPPSGGWTCSTIENVASGLYLDVYGDSIDADATIDTWYGNGGWNQCWADFATNNPNI
jgi:hypothetical protein